MWGIYFFLASISDMQPQFLIYEKKKYFNPFINNPAINITPDIHIQWGLTKARLELISLSLFKKNPAGGRVNPWYLKNLFQGAPSLKQHSMQEGHMGYKQTSFK